MRTFFFALFLALALAPNAQAYMMDTMPNTPLESCTIQLNRAEAKLEAARQNRPDSEFVTRAEYESAKQTNNGLSIWIMAVGVLLLLGSFGIKRRMG